MKPLTPIEKQILIGMNIGAQDKPKPPLLSVTVAGGKYTVIQDERGHLKALRYGEPWRDLVGDNLVLALAQEVQELREAIAGSNKALLEAGKTIDQLNQALYGHMILGGQA